MRFRTMRFIKTIICVAAALSSAAFGRVSAGEKDFEFDDTAWETATGQDEFDEIPLLPENSDVPPPPVIPVTPAVVKIEHIYPYAQSAEKNKDKPGEQDDLLDHATGVSLVSGGTLLSLVAALAIVAMAGKALLLASGAIIIACLSGGAWTWAGGTGESSDSAVAYGVVAAETQELLREPYGDEHGHFFFGHGRRREEERSARKS